MWITFLACGVAAPPGPQPFDPPGPQPFDPPVPAIVAPDPLEAAFAAHPSPPPGRKAALALAKARSYIGVPYRWEGRDTQQFPGLDCLGLLYRSWGSVDGTPWQRYPPDPSPLVASRRLGVPVPGLDGVQRADLDVAAMLPGDVLFLLVANHPIPDAPLWTRDEVPYWPWHTALYAGDGKVLEASPMGDVRESPLAYLSWDALFVTRIAE